MVDGPPPMRTSPPPAARLALHGAEGTSREKPLVQPGSRMAKRGIQALPRAGAEPIQRHREVVHPDPRHDDLLTSCFTATGTGCRIPAPVRSRRSLTRCLDLRWDDDAFCGREPVEIIQASEPARSGLD